MRVNFPVQGPSFRPPSGTWGVYQNSQGIGHSAPVQGYSHLMYLDDWLSASGLSRAAWGSLNTLLAATCHLVCLTNVSESDLTPSQRFCDLGFAVQHSQLYCDPRAETGGSPAEASLPFTRGFPGISETDVGLLGSWSLSPRFSSGAAAQAGVQTRFCVS